MNVVGGLAFIDYLQVDEPEYDHFGVLLDYKDGDQGSGSITKIATNCKFFIIYFLKNKNYFVLRNAGLACSRNT